MSYYPDSMRDNPGLFLEREELPADQDTQTVILGSLIALGLGVAGVVVIEAGVSFVGQRVDPNMSEALGLLLRGGVGVAAGLWVACHYPVIGASLLGATAVSVVGQVFRVDDWGNGARSLQPFTTPTDEDDEEVATPATSRPA